MLKLSAMAACRSEYERELLKQTDAYAGWIAEEERKEISGRQVTGGPLITVVPYGHDSKWQQTYSKIEYLKEGIDLLDFGAMNGEYVAFVNGDGELRGDAISTFVEKLNYDLAYSDEDCILENDHTRCNPFFKPDASPDTLHSFFYFQNLFVVQKEKASKIRTLQTGTEVERLYDFAQKYMSESSEVVHVPQVLYHKKVKSEVDKITYAINEISENIISEDQMPLVSIIIPSKDHPEILKQCTESIKIKSQYNNYEVVIIDNGSSTEVKENLTRYADENGYAYLYEPMDFNYSVLCHLGAEKAKGEYLLFLNDDIEVGDGMFIEKLLRYASMSHVGAAGAKLLYPDSDIIQHVGITSLKCGPSHKLATFSDSEDHYFGRNRYNYNVLAVTGACLMVSREKYFQVGGFSDKMGVSYNDVDLCISLYEKGLYNVICNDTFLYHHESLSRGTDLVSKEKYQRLVEERKLLYDRHAWLQNGDPFYNVNLIQDTLEYKPNVICDHASFGYYNTCEHVKVAFGDLRFCKDAQVVIEKTESVRGFDSEEDDYYQIEGWSLHRKRDNACLQRRLYLIPPDGDALVVEVSRKYREDVPRVFPKARNSALAGFVCRIRKKYLIPGMTYQTVMSAESQVTKAKYLSLGEPYESTGK